MTTPATAVPTTTGASTLVALCDAFYDVIGDFTMDDAQTAAKLHAIASSADSNPQLQAAIRDIANQFEAQDEQILSTPVNTLCGST